MAKRLVPLGKAIIWFKGTEAEKDEQAAKMALSDDEAIQVSAQFWRNKVRDQYRRVLNANPAQVPDEEEIDANSLRDSREVLR